MHSSNSQRTKVLKVVRREEQVEETLEAVTNTNIEYLLLSGVIFPNSDFKSFHVEQKAVSGANFIKIAQWEHKK